MEKDGGQAFPLSCGQCGSDVPGMSLRDWFAGHAPTEPQKWFAPTMSPYPEPEKSWAYCDSCKWGRHRVQECVGGRDCEKIDAVKKKQREWKEERDRRLHVEWPYAWADAMLEARK